MKEMWRGQSEGRDQNTFGVQQNHSLSGFEGFNPPELLFKESNEALQPNTSQEAAFKSQNSFRDNSLEEHSVNREGGSCFLAVNACPMEMTWAQRVQAGGSPDTLPPHSKHPLPRQDLLHKSFAYDSLPGSSKGLPVASISGSSHVLSPLLNELALPTTSSTKSHTSRGGRSGNSKSTRGLSKEEHQLAAKATGSRGQRRAVKESDPQAKGFIWGSEKPARISSHWGGVDEDLREDSKSLVRTPSDKVHPEEEDQGSKWHIVVRKNRSSETARSSKAIKSTTRKARTLKRSSKSQASLPPGQDAALIPPKPNTSPSLRTRSPFSPISDLGPKLLKPRYAAVSSLHSPVISLSSRTTSSADAPFISALQSPAHTHSTLELLLGSPETSEEYFSALEDLEEIAHSPTLEPASEGQSGACEAPAAKESADAGCLSTYSAYAPAESYCKRALAAKDNSASSPKLGTTDIVLGLSDPVRSIVPRRHSPGSSLQDSASEFRREINDSKPQDKKFSSDVSFKPPSDEASAGIGHTRVEDDSMNAQEKPDLVLKDSLLSEFDGAFGQLTPLPQPTIAATEQGTKYTNAVSSHRTHPQDRTMSAEREKELSPQILGDSLTESTLPPSKEDAFPSEPKAPTSKTPRGRKRKNVKRYTKPDASITDTAAEPSQIAPEFSSISSMSSRHTPPRFNNAVTSPSSHHRERRSTSASLSNIEQSLLSDSQPRGRSAGKVNHELSIPGSVDMSRDGSILRGEAPKFTPQTTPSKTTSSQLDTPAHSNLPTPGDFVRRPSVGLASLAPEELPIPLQPISSAHVSSRESILMPWMSMDFWLPKNTRATGHETQCALVSKKPLSGERASTSTTSDHPRYIGQIRRLKPCGFVKVEQAVEQIGTWCPKCNPDF